MSDSLIAAQRNYIALRRTKDDLEKRAKDVGKQMADLEPVIAEQMAAIGQSHTILDGARLTVQTKSRISKRGDVDTALLCAVFGKDPDLAFLVRPNVHPQQMQAALREIIEERGSLPDAVEPLVRVYDQTILAVAKA